MELKFCSTADILICNKYIVYLQESLRDFSRIKGDFKHLPIFSDSEKSYNLLVHILKKYLTEEVLCNSDNVDSHIQVAEILQNCLIKNKSMMKCFERVIERIIVLEQTDKSRKYLQELINKSEELKVDTSLVEQIYKTQKSWLIDKPLSDYFDYYSSEDKKQLVPDMTVLFEKIIDNPSLFELVAVRLKDSFVDTEYSQEAQDFIQKILESIQKHCDKYHKDMVDLYPAHLQFCVILLRIKPVHHSEKSKNHTVNSLKEIFLKSHTDALILLSHFPDWLPDYLKFFDILEEQLSQGSSYSEPMSQD